MSLAVELTRITFPYLALVSLVVLWTGVLNAEKRFVAGAAAPVLLNMAMISTLLLAGFFASGAHAAAWGVLIAGVLEAGLLMVAAWRAGLIAPPVLPRWNGELARFFRAFGPAVIGSAGVQIAMLADTILVTFLPAGGASSLYYADRLYQLPIGVIGVAAGTVLLPEMAKRLAAGDEPGAHRAQNQSLAISLMLAIPFTAAFLFIPQEIIAGSSATAPSEPRPLQPRLPCSRPMPGACRQWWRSARWSRASCAGRYPHAALCLADRDCAQSALKLLLWRDYGAAGLALATAIGAIANALILAALAIRQKKAGPDAELGLQLAIALIGTIWLVATLLLVREVFGPGLEGLPAFLGSWCSPEQARWPMRHPVRLRADCATAAALSLISGGCRP